jgi:hypothetical protein
MTDPWIGQRYESGYSNWMDSMIVQLLPVAGVRRGIDDEPGAVDVEDDDSLRDEASCDAATGEPLRGPIVHARWIGGTEGPPS